MTAVSPLGKCGWVAQSFYRKTGAHDFRISVRSLSVCAAWRAPMSRSSDDARRFVERLSHTNLAGAQVLAGFVADAIKNQGIGLAQYLR